MKNASSMTDDEAIIRDSIQKGFSDHLQVIKLPLHGMKFLSAFPDHTFTISTYLTFRLKKRHYLTIALFMEMKQVLIIPSFYRMAFSLGAHFTIMLISRVAYEDSALFSIRPNSLIHMIILNSPSSLRHHLKMHV